VIDLGELRAAGVASAMRRALDRVAVPILDGFWIHLDADALGDGIMPAVDYRLPDGLKWEELVPILRAAMRSRRALGIDVTIFNPKLDPDRAITKRFVRAICDGLTEDQAAGG
jgi:arginase